MGGQWAAPLLLVAAAATTITLTPTLASPVDALGAPLNALARVWDTLETRRIERSARTARDLTNKSLEVPEDALAETKEALEEPGNTLESPLQMERQYQPSGDPPLTVADTFQPPENPIQEVGSFIHFLGEVLQRLQGLFHDLYELEMLPDDRWMGWLHNLQLMVTDMHHTSFWDVVQEAMVTRETVHHINSSQTGDVDLQLTEVTYDPIGNLFWAALRGFHEFIGLPTFFEWWERFQALHSYYATTTTSTTPHTLSIFNEDAIIEAQQAEGEDRLPSDVISVAAYDPYVVGVNTMLFMFYKYMFSEYLLEFVCRI